MVGTIRNTEVEEEIAETFEFDIGDIESVALDYNVEPCSLCGWWHRSEDMAEMDDEDNLPVCLDCSPDEEDGEEE